MLRKSVQRLLLTVLFLINMVFLVSFASALAIWEVSPDDGGFLFTSADCNVFLGNVCPPEMGWEGNTVYYIFNLTDQPLSDEIELEFNVTFRNYLGTPDVILEISAGMNKQNLQIIESNLDINRLGKFIIPINSSVFQEGTNYIKLYGKNIAPIGYGTNPPNFKIDYIALNSIGNPPVPVISDDVLLDKTQAQAAKYFYEQALSNGFVKDTSTTDFSSIAATGFGLTAFAVMAERYGSTSEWTYTPEQLRVRTNQILDALIDIQNGQSQSESFYGKEGLFYHFIRADGTRAPGSEVSTIDSAILFAGIITAGEYFQGETKQKADTILERANWSYFLKTPQNNFPSNNGIDYQFSHGWDPSSGIFRQTWDRPGDESILISVISLTSDPNNTDFQKSLFSWQRVKRNYAGYELVNSYFGSLFTYEFAHAWIDFQAIGKDKPNEIMPGVEAVDWWENSINATKASRQFVIDNSAAYSSYGSDSWGLSAVYKPNGQYEGGYGALPTDSGSAFHDGTIAPYSSVSTMPFFIREDNRNLSNNLGFKALRHFYDNYYWDLWGQYGPKDSFNSNNEFSRIYLGIDQGPIVLMIENYRTGFVWRQFLKDETVKTAIKKVFECPSQPGVYGPGVGACDLLPPVIEVTPLVLNMSFNEPRGVSVFEDIGSGNSNPGICAVGALGGMCGREDIENPANSVEGSAQGTRAVFLNGDYLRIPDILYDLRNGFTISTWVKIDNSVAGNRYIIERRDLNDAFERNFLLYVGNDGFARFTFNSLNKTNDCYAVGVTNIKDNQWHHVTAVYEVPATGNKKCKLYVDNVLEKTDGLILGYPLGYGQNIYIGGNVYKNTAGKVVVGAKLKGWVDGLRIYDRALNTTEVNGLYTHVPAGREIIDIRFDEQLPYFVDFVSLWSNNALCYNGFCSRVNINGKEGNSFFSHTLLPLQYAKINNAPEFDLQDEFTVSTWVRLFGNSTGNKYIIDKRNLNNGTERNFLLYVDSNGKARFTFNSLNKTGDCSVAGITDIRDNSWHHITGVYTGSVDKKCKLYVDALAVRTDGLVLGTPLGVGQDIYIGANVYKNAGGTILANDKLNGWVDEVKIYYSRALNASQISVL